MKKRTKAAVDYFAEVTEREFYIIINNLNQ